MPSTCRVKVNSNVDDSRGVYSVSFTNGVLETGRELESALYENADNSNMKKLVLSAGEMDYVGNFDTSKRDLGKYIGIEDVESGEMTLVPLKRIRLRPAISLAQEGIEEEATPAALTRQQQSDNLIESFGGAKQRLNMLRRQRHGIDKAMIHDALNATQVHELDVSKVASPAQTSSDSAILPPHDADADDPADAYPLDGYFPPHVATALTDHVKDFTSASSSDIQKWQREQSYPQLVLEQLEKLPLAEEEKQQSAVLIKYLHLLIRLYKLRANDLRAKDPFKSKDDTTNSGGDAMPSDCLTYVLDTYTAKASRGRSMPTRLRDKLLVTIILICLRLEQYTVTARFILSDLHLSSKKLLTVAKGMGCKVSLSRKSEENEEQTITISLKTPLVFPKSRPTAKRR